MIHLTQNIEIAKGKSFYLIFFGDVHWNTKECDRDRFQRTIDQAAKWKRQGHAVGLYGLGDYNDSLSTSERQAMTVLHDFTHERMDEWGIEISKTFYQVLKPVADNFIGLCEGHHYMTFATDIADGYRGATNTKYLCNELLRAQYMGTCGYVTLKFIDDLQYQFISHHGVGAAQTRNARILRRKRFGEAFPEANAVVMGHDHDLFIEPDQGIGFDEDGMKSAGRLYIASGSYLRGYILGKEIGTYVEQRAYKPGQLGSPVLQFTIARGRRGKKLDLGWFTI